MMTIASLQVGAPLDYNTLTVSKTSTINYFYIQIPLTTIFMSA